MANFKTHKNIGIVSTLAATCGIYFLNTIKSTIPGAFQGIFDIQLNIFTMAAMVLLGIIGSLIPDIDLKTSTPSKFFKIFIYFMTFVIGTFIFTHLKTELQRIFETTELYLMLGFMGVAFIVGTMIIKFFQSSMIHRGVVHSIPFAFVCSILLYELFSLQILYGINIIDSFFVSVAFFNGFLTHLLLDEVYSVDLRGIRLKSSFGTALKIIDKKNKIGSSMLILLSISYMLFSSSII